VHAKPGHSCPSETENHYKPQEPCRARLPTLPTNVHFINARALPSMNVNVSIELATVSGAVTNTDKTFHTVLRMAATCANPSFHNAEVQMD